MLVVFWQTCNEEDVLMKSPDISGPYIVIQFCKKNLKSFQLYKLYELDKL